MAAFRLGLPIAQQPIASTGSAAAELYESEMMIGADSVREALAWDRSYPRLFRRIFKGWRLG